jgi:hypothetical protein
MIEPVARIRISLRGAQPEIWRLLDVPLSTTLLSLHDLIQIAMGWTGTHRFAFDVGSKRYGVPDPGDLAGVRRVLKAKGMPLHRLVERGCQRFDYTYDFGDDWVHDVVVEACRVGKNDIDYPVFVSGAGRCPPEDVGGMSGFEDFVDAIRNPRHPEHRRMIRWYGGTFEQANINADHVRKVFESIALRRRGPLMSHRGTRQRHLNS